MKLKDVFLSVFSRGIAAVLAFAVGVFVARFLGPTGQGYYFFAITFSATLLQFGHLGLHSSNTFEAAKDPSAAPRLLMNSIWISSAGGILLASVALAVVKISGWWGQVPWLYLVLGAAMVPARLMFLLGTSVLLGIGRLPVFNGLVCLNYLFILVAVAVAWFVNADVAGYLLATLVGWILSMGAVLVSTREWLQGGFGFHAPGFRSGFSFATKAYVLCILSFVVTRGNVFVLQSISGPQEVGFYSIAAQCGDAMTLIPATVASILFPELVKDGEKRLGRTYAALRRTSLFMGAVCILVGLLARPLVQGVFGARYAPVVPILLWSLPGVFFYALTSLLSQYLGSLGFPKALLAIWGGVAAILCGLGLILIPVYGGRGAAMALSCAYGLAFVAQLWLIHRVNAGHPVPLAAKESAGG